MKRALLIVGTCLGVWQSTAQVFPVDTLMKNGPIESRINLVFLSDGYQAHEIETYLADANGLLTNMFNQVPFKHYKNYFNAFAVKVPSVASGASHPRTSPDNDCASVPALTVDNYFGSSFDRYNIHRLLSPSKLPTVVSVLASSFPLYDQAFIVVNSPYYGGSGGDFATSSTHVSAHHVSIHEIGHSFARLADEYWAGQSYAAEKPNLTQQSNASLVKWANWVGTNNVGVYPHAESPSWYRPHQNCKMRLLNAPFCNVCNETFVERIHALVNPVESYTPVLLTHDLGEEAIEFSLSLISPEPNTLSVSWKNNNVSFASNVESVVLQPSAFTAALTKITATVTDNTTLSRSNTHTTSHVYVIEWTITKNDPVTGVNVKSEMHEYQVTVYPNPVADDFNFSYVLPQPARVNITVFDMQGKRVKSLVSQYQNNGEHAFRFKAADVFGSSGEYILKFSFDDMIISRKVVR
ncbi:MAG: T9SS C-terminal target domain-containing protein [Bacteroidetes bacterium CHB5]|nr:T9SS C-terminal target domain-containing protein [Bacteroidetes bacterium CHB5]